MWGVRPAMQPGGLGVLVSMVNSMRAGRMLWSEICSSREFQGRWVALDGVEYDETAARPFEGTIVDVDDDLARLCARMRKLHRTCCGVFFCDPHTRTPEPARRPGLRAAAP